MENVIKVLSAVGGAAVTFLFGGWSYLLTVLIVFVGIDYASGIAAGAAEGKAKKQNWTHRYCKKAFYFWDRCYCSHAGYCFRGSTCDS